MMQRVALYFYLKATTVGLLIFFIAVTFPGASFCIVKETLGVPCPACGATRSVVSLIHLSFADSFNWNPCLWITVLGFGFLLMLRRNDLESIKYASKMALMIGLLSGCLRALVYFLGISTRFTDLAF